MTREEIKLKIDKEFANENKCIIETSKEIIDKIYDDFEKQTCKNCKYFENGYCFNEYIQQWYDVRIGKGVYMDFVFLQPFGCNKFKLKDKE